MEEPRAEEMATLDLHPFGDVFFELDEGFPSCDDFPFFGELAPDACINCSFSNWLLDDSRGLFVCGNCGLCGETVSVNNPVHHESNGDGAPAMAPNLLFDCLHRRELQIETGPSLEKIQRRGTKRANGKLRTKQPKYVPYKKRTYFNERLSQWALTDPDIDDGDWGRICCAYIDFCIERGITVHIPTKEELAMSRGKRIANTYAVTKNDVRLILARCDAVTVQKDQPLAFGDIDEHCLQTGWFRQKYVEKWLKIRYLLCGMTSTFDDCPSWLPEKLREQFQALQAPFWAGVFGNKRRKSFPNYNLGFRRLLELNNQTHALADFPPITTRSKIKTFCQNWWTMCNHLQWPYINCDDPFLTKHLNKIANGTYPRTKRISQNLHSGIHPRRRPNCRGR